MLIVKWCSSVIESRDWGKVVEMLGNGKDEPIGDEQWAQGCTLFDERRFDDAVAVWREALRLNPNHASARYNVGVALSQSGQIEPALIEWRETVRRHPDFWKAHENLGYVFLTRARKNNKRRDWKAARDAYRKVLAVRPDDIALLYWMSVMEWKVGNRRAAIASLQRVIEADPSREGALYQLGEWQCRMGHWRGLWRTASALISLPTYDPANYPINPVRVFLRLVLPAMALVSAILVIRKLCKNEN